MRTKIMASKQSEKLKNLYASWKRLITPDMSLEEQRDLIEDWAVITAEPRGVDYAETEAGGVPALWAVPKGAAQDRVILSIHGGGFITGSMYTHRKLFGHIAKASGARALIVNARKAGVDVRIDIFPEQQHTFQMGAGRAPEADHAIRKLAQWVRPKLGLPVL